MFCRYIILIFRLNFLHKNIDCPFGRQARPEGLHHQGLLSHGRRPVGQRDLPVLVDVQLPQCHVDQVLHD